MSFQRLTMDSKGQGWIDCRIVAQTAAAYCFCSSLLVALLYSWRIAVISQSFTYPGDVYYGVQISYSATLVAHLLLMGLAFVLCIGIRKENENLISLWLIGQMSLLSFEGISCVYSNVLRDHINKKFDMFCRVEVIFFICRALMTVFALWGVIRFHRKIRTGYSYKDPEAHPL